MNCGFTVEKPSKTVSKCQGKGTIQIKDVLLNLQSTGFIKIPASFLFMVKLQAKEN